MTFAHLAEASVEQITTAIERGGLKFAPSVPTWAKQSALLAAGDEAAFAAYTDHLVAGREPGQN